MDRTKVVANYTRLHSIAQEKIQKRESREKNFTDEA
jgi:hypothetical protein